MTALVFNCAYNGLSIIQELGRQGVDVYALDSFRNVGTVSRFGTYLSCPNAATAPDEFISYLLEIAGDFEDLPVLFPTNDHWALAIANHREELTEEYRPCVADGSTVKLLLNKYRFSKWAIERGFDAPMSWSSDEYSNIPASAFPIAAKPIDASRYPDMMFESTIAVLYNRLFGNKTSDSDLTDVRTAKHLLDNQLEVLETTAELHSFIDEHSGFLDEFVFQEYIRGMSNQMYSVGLYAKEGEVKGLFTGRKLRGYPPDIGDCKLGQMEEVPDEIVETSIAIVEELQYTGIAEFEFKRDVMTEEFSLIEANPRSWSWIGITPTAGANLPWIAYRDMKNQEVQPTTATEPTGLVKWVKASEDLPNCLMGYKRWGYDEWSMSLRKWLESIRAEKTVFVDFSKDDPLPTGYALLLLLRRGLIGVADTIRETSFQNPWFSRPVLARK